MRAAAVVLAALLAAPGWAQSAAPKPEAKSGAPKPEAKSATPKPAKPAPRASAKAPKAHRAPTPEQIRKFDRLEEKRGQR